MKELRRSGKTMSGVLEAISKAMVNRDEFIYCVDHYQPQTMRHAELLVKREMIRVLSLLGIKKNEYKIEIRKEDKAVGLNLKPYGLLMSEDNCTGLDLRNGRTKSFM